MQRGRPWGKAWDDLRCKISVESVESPCIPSVQSVQSVQAWLPFCSQRGGLHRHTRDIGMTLEYPGIPWNGRSSVPPMNSTRHQCAVRLSETLRDPQRLSETRVQTWVSIYSWSMLIIHLDPSLVTGGTLTHPRWNLLKKIEPWSVLKCHLGLCISGFLADLFLLIQLLATNVACWTRSDCVADSVLTLCWLCADSVLTWWT